MKKVRLEELCDNLWEGLGGEVLSVTPHSKYGLKIRFQCENWDGSSEFRNFIITCHDVADSTVCPVQCDELALEKEHVVLWKHNLPHFQLFYNSVPKNAYETLGRLLEVHDKTFSAVGAITEFIDPVNFLKYNSGGLGLLARGPEPQLKVYQDAILEQVNTYMISSYEPEGGFSVLWFEVGHVIARSFEIEEIFESIEE